MSAEPEVLGDLHLGPSRTLDGAELAEGRDAEDRPVLVEIIAPGPDAASLGRALERQVAAYTDGGARLQPLLRTGALPDGRVYLMRAIVDGGPPSALDPAAGLRILSQVAEGLALLHARGTCHGALGADVVLIDSEGARLCAPPLAILAAALADPLGRATIERRARYLAPEVIRGRRPDGRADLYALGVLAHELVLGRPPFEAERADDILAMHLAEPPPRFAGPRDLDPLLGALLAKDPAQRIEARVAQQLFALLALEPPPPRSLWQRLRDALRR